MTNGNRNSNSKNRNRNRNRNRNNNNRKQNNRGNSRPRHHHSQGPARHKPSAEEQQFLAGTAIIPNERIMLSKGSAELTVRALDLVCPIGKGQRGLIIASAGSGKTTFLKHISNAVTKAYPDIVIKCALINERPEEVTDFKRGVAAEVFSSSIDQSYDSHVKVADTVMAEAFKDAAAGKDVLVLIDSLTRLARVHNSQRRSGGRTMSGGVDAGALEVPRRIFGAARKVEGQGSITILATVLVDTGSRMDEVIYEEFKGTGNMELVLSRKLSERWVFPAIDIAKSHTRRWELLYPENEFKMLQLLNKGLAELDDVTAMEYLIKLLNKHPDNTELLMKFSL